MAEREYLPLILFTAILSALCTFARNMIDYQQIVQCRQAQKASALRLHPSAPICTDTIPHTPHDKTGVPPAHYGIGGANFLSEQQIFLPPYTFFLTGTNDMTPPAQARVQRAVQTNSALTYTIFHIDNQSITRH